jgi:molybdopterin molybdotransferase
MGAGDDGIQLPRFPAVLISDLENDGDRPHYVRGQLREGRFTAIGRQESHALYGLSRANALLRVAANENLRAGTTVSVIALD